MMIVYTIFFLLSVSCPRPVPPPVEKQKQPGFCFAVERPRAKRRHS